MSESVVQGSRIGHSFGQADDDSPMLLATVVKTALTMTVLTMLRSFLETASGVRWLTTSA